ncbi:darcynin family protein [Amycolatopsis sp. NPDC051045]|uniref:darcynin family protein n=1 Tax=Amycolatopsis sp. NPDC051045 TaxID=3156922 RepID=UPI003436A96B
MTAFLLVKTTPEWLAMTVAERVRAFTTQVGGPRTATPARTAWNRRRPSPPDSRCVRASTARVREGRLEELGIPQSGLHAGRTCPENATAAQQGPMEDAWSFGSLPT